jgi:hypothetical protein
MSDGILIELAPGWALGFDQLQWILGKVNLAQSVSLRTPPEGKKPVAGARLRPIAFIASTKAVLWRVIHENEVQPTPEASEYIEAMPGSFRVWYRRHGLRVVPEVMEAA